MFVTETECETSDRKCEGEFTVIKGTSKMLLGRRTAEKLGVLIVEAWTPQTTTHLFCHRRE